MSPRPESSLRRIWRSLFGPSRAEINSPPEQMSEETKAYLRKRQARLDFTKATQYPHNVLTSHGRSITPYRIEVTDRGSIRSNLIEFATQPRVRELAAQMKPLLKAKPDDGLMLDEGTGRFYLKSQLERYGVEKAEALGEIDMKTEIMLFKHAAQNVAMQRLFGDASPRNPIVLDEATGKVYPKNNPKELRGTVKLGAPVINEPRPGRRR